MSVPDYQSIMLPLLELASDGQVHTFSSAVDCLAESFSLTESDLQELLPSGKQTTFRNRVGWAKTYLLKAGLLESPKRSRFRITDAGQTVLSEPPPQIDVQFLQQFPAFLEFQNLRHDRTGKPAHASSQAGQTSTPEETLEAAYEAMRDDLAAEVLDQVKKSSPQFFEQLVVDLLVAMGYGGSRTEAGKAVGKSGDGGIDGIIKEDRLGLDIIYLQAKRWEAVVGRPEIQKFAGALQGQRARKGVFLTTSGFSKEARDYASNIESKKIILIDGAELADYMIDHGIGVSTEASYVVKKVDTDYFSDD